jgi:hypothetical protein
MITREQSERSEEAVRTILTNQFPVLTTQVLENLYQLSRIGEKWSTKLLLIMGAVLLLASLVMKLLMLIGYRDGRGVELLSGMEFSTVILASSALLVVGALLSLLQAWSWRSIVRAQQAVGIEILHKQLDIEKELLTSRNRNQPGELILLPTKIRKRHRR